MRSITAGAALAAVSWIAGCTSPTDTKFGGEAATVAMYLESVPVSRNAIIGMLPGTTTLHFSGGVNDAAGQTLINAHPSVVSRNTAAIVIDSTGLLRVVGRGSSWLVVGYNSPTRGVIADSVTAAVVCTTEARAALNLSVSDSLTGTAANITSLAISARFGTVRDSIFYPVVPSGTGVLSLGLAYERAGVWDLRITADGYTPWAALGVVVGADLCHVIGVSLSAKLQKL